MTAVCVDSAARMLIGPDGIASSCAIGRAGACPAGDKREGDGKTPLGSWPVRCVLFRAGRSAPPQGMKLPWRWVGDADGWSDDPVDAAYNRPVRHPHAFSAERLVREDGLYDIIVVLGHNDAPPVPGLGSAIFLHCSAGEKPTEGCVAIPVERLAVLVRVLAPGDVVDIR